MRDLRTEAPEPDQPEACPPQVPTDADLPSTSAHRLGLLVQAMCVYFFTALLKSDPVWLEQGTAVYYALANDSLVLPFGEWLRQFAPLPCISS